MKNVLIQENSANKPMYTEPPYVLGVINAPDSHYIPELYNHYKETVAFNRLDADIFEKTAKSKPADRHRASAPVKTALAVISLGVLFLLAKMFRLKK